MGDTRKEERASERETDRERSCWYLFSPVAASGSFPLLIKH